MSLQNLSNEELLALAQKKGLLANKAAGLSDETMDNARQSVFDNPAASLTAYGANVMQNIPFSDEAGSAIAALPKLLQGGEAYGSEYDRLQKAQRAMRKAGQENNPVATGVGEVSGAILSGMAAPAPQTLPASFMGKVGQGMAVGGGYGALYGAGSGEGFEDRMKKAMSGAEGGAAVGAILPVVAEGAKMVGDKVVRPIADKLLPPDQPVNFMGAEIYRTTPADAAAADYMQGKLKGESIDDLLARIKSGSDDTPLMLAEKGGTDLSGAAEGLAQRPGKQADFAGKVIGTRQALQQDRLGGILDEHFPNVSQSQLEEQIGKITKEKARPLYDAAYAANTKIADPEIDKIFDSVSNAGDWGTLTNTARKIAAYEGRTLGNLDRETGAATSWSTQDLDYMSRALRELGRGTIGQGTFGGMTALGRLQNQAAEGIRSRLKTLNPDFGQATQTFADGATLNDALQTGATFDRMSTDSFKSEFKDLPDNAKEAFKIGMGNRIRDILETNADNQTTQALKGRLLSKQVKENIKAVLGPEEFQALQEKLQPELVMQQAPRKFLQGSPTARRQAYQSDFNDQAASSLFDLAPVVTSGGNPNSVMNWIGKQVQTAKGPRQEIAEQLLPLFSTNKASQIKFLEKMSDAQKRSMAEKLLSAQDAGYQRLPIFLNQLMYSGADN